MKPHPPSTPVNVGMTPRHRNMLSQSRQSTPKSIRSTQWTPRSTQSTPRSMQSQIRKRSIRTYERIPEHVKNNIENLYEAMKHTLGMDERIRKRKFISILKVYYKWENPETLLYFYNTLIKNKDQEYLIDKNSKELEQTYHSIVSKLFGCINTNGDSGIDLNEFKCALDFLEVDVDELFKEADKDGNGVLDIIEFYDLVAKTNLLRENFVDIISNMHAKNDRRNMLKLSRLFSSNINHPNFRPSLANMKNVNDIKSSDIPLYGVQLPPLASQSSVRYYGHMNEKKLQQMY